MCACVQVPGGIIEDSCVLRGVMVNKDVTHPRMRRVIKDPRIILLDCSLEYKKGESQVTHTHTSLSHTFVVVLSHDTFVCVCADGHRDQ